MAILETEMVDMEEIFLPYVINRNGQTLYQAFQSNQLRRKWGIKDDNSKSK